MSDIIPLHSAGDLVCEAPNNVLAKFDGTLNIESNTLPLTNDQMLLRGCVLRNTKWCYGLVVFAGQDTKLMKNSGLTTFKRTHTDRLLNQLIIGVRRGRSLVSVSFAVHNIAAKQAFSNYCLYMK